jgi:hypothetical protein
MVRTSSATPSPSPSPSPTPPPPKIRGHLAEPPLKRPNPLKSPLVLVVLATVIASAAGIAFASIR